MKNTPSYYAHNKSRRSQAGFGLVQVLVVMAIMSVLALGIGTLITSVTGQQAHLTKAFEKQKTFDNLRATISNTSQCATTLGIQGLTPAALAVGLDSLTLISGETISSTTPSADGLVASGPLMFLDQGNAGTQRQIGPDGASEDYNLISANIKTVPGPNGGIAMQKATGSSGSFDTFKPESFPIILLVRTTARPGLPAGTVDFCFSGGNTNDQTCEDMFGGVYDSDFDVKCRINKFTTSGTYHTEQITVPGGIASQDSISLFAVGGTNTLRFYDATVTGAAPPIVGPTTAFTYGAINHSFAGGFAFIPSAVAPTNLMTLTTANLEIEGLPGGVSIEKAASAIPALTVNGGAAGAGLRVTGNNVLTGTSTLNAPAGTVPLNVTGTGANAANFVGGVLLSGGANALTVIGPTNFTGGNMTFTGDINVTGQVHASSDRRLKNDIKQITDALNKISQIEGVTYLMKDAGDQHQMGVIAQEVERVFPEAVHKNENGYLSVNYSALVAPLIESVKQLKTEQDDLKAELAEIRRELASMKSKNKKK